MWGRVEWHLLGEDHTPIKERRLGVVHKQHGSHVVVIVEVQLSLTSTMTSIRIGRGRMHKFHNDGMSCVFEALNKRFPWMLYCTPMGIYF